MIVHACAVPMNVPGLLRITAAALFWLLPSSSVFLSAAETETGSEVTVWIGTGKSSLSQGIYVCSLDQKTGKLTVPVLAEIGRAHV